MFKNSTSILEDKSNYVITALENSDKERLR